MPKPNSPKTSPLASVSMLVSVLESAVDAIVTINDAGVIQSVNPATEKLFGYGADELIGKNISILMEGTYRAKHDDYIASYLATSKKKIIGIGREVEARHKDGDVFPIHLSVSEFWHEENRYFAGIIHDIRQRKEAEEKLRKSEEQLGSILEASSDGWWSYRFSDKTVTWSDGVFRMFGYEPGEFVPTLALEVESTHPSDLTARRDALKSHLLYDRPYLVNFRFRNKTGNYIWVRASGKVMRDDLGKPVHMIGAVSDISETIEKDEQLQRALRLETIGQLTGGIAHDFNNILTVISGNLEFLEMQLSENDQLELLKEAMEATEMGATLTDRLLTFARRRHIEPETVNLNDIVLRLSDMLRRTLGGQIDLSTVVSPDLWATRVDPGQVENAIMNLVINARDAMPDGGRVIVETKNAVLDVDYVENEPALDPGDYVLLTVTDTGIGMTEDVREHVFEPFFTTKEVGHGTGLGLSMVYGFAKQARGHTTLYSEVGVGTTVNIYLPAFGRNKRKVAVSDGASSIVFGEGQKILVVEDDPKVRVLTIRRVKELGYNVLEADNALKALEILDREDGIDLVFTDIVMPGGMSGYELAEEIRKTHPDIKILLTSGYAEELVHPDTLQKYELRVLRKPYRREALAESLAEALR